MHALTAYRQQGQALTLQVIEEGIAKDRRDYADAKGGKDLFEQRCAGDFIYLFYYYYFFAPKCKNLH